ncbi:MAG: hypothetical protein D6695_11205 [Planctomycetota bacterium]|nr:MAG: hypothetical protein D6695_11205 [Planctomycetota bacterium]
MKFRPPNPVRLFFGPIFQMEMRTSGRRTSTYVFRFLFAAVVTFFFALFLFGSSQQFDAQGSVVARLQQLQGLAPELALTVLWTQYVGLLLLAPIITGSALCEERRQRTLPALLTTPMTSWEIVLNKLSGRLTQTLILAAISVPVMLGARLLGGLSAEGVLAAVLLTFISLIQMASLSLLLSAGSTRATTAASSAFVLFLFFNFVPALAFATYNEWIAPKLGWSPIGVQFLFQSSLPISFGAVLIEHFVGDSTGLTPMNVYGWSALYGVCVTLLAILAAGLQLRRTMRQDPEGIQMRKKLRKRRRRSRGTPDAECVSADLAEAHEQSRASRMVGDHPVLWRELRQKTFPRRGMFIAAVLGTIALLALLYSNVGLNDETTHYVTIVTGVLLLLAQAVFATTGTIPNEREARTLEVLLTTPLAPGSIILGKLVGAIRRLWFAPAVVLVHLAIAIATGHVHWAILVLLPLAVLPASFMILCTGLLAGVWFRKAISAGIANLALPVGLYAFLPFLLVLSTNIFYSWSDSYIEKALTVLSVVNPLAMAAVSINGTLTFTWRDANTLSDLEFSLPAFDELSFGSYAMFLLVAGVVQVGVGIAAMAIAAKWLPLREGRPQ